MIGYYYYKKAVTGWRNNNLSVYGGLLLTDEYEQDNLEVTVYEESVQTTDGQKEYTSYQEAWKRFGGGGPVMKRKIAIAAGILVTAVSTISGSYAYYQDSVTVTNHISTGDVNIGIQEYEKDGDTEKVYEGPADGIVLPSQSISKIPRITNYAETCYIRVKTTLFRRGIGFRVKR